MRILFLTTVLPYTLRTGGEIVSSAFIHAQRRTGHQVHVVGFERPDGDRSLLHPDDLPLPKRPIESQGATPQTARWAARALLTGRPLSVAKYVSVHYLRAVDRLVEAKAPNLTVIDHAQAGWVLQRRAYLPYPVLLAHNVEHLLYRDIASAMNASPRRWVIAREARRIRELEERLLRMSRRVWTIGDADADVFHELHPPTPLRRFEVPAREPKGGFDPGPPSTDVILLGTWTWQANRESLSWFLCDILPLLPDDVSVRVGGVGGDDLLRGVERVDYRGFVDNPAEFLSSGRVIAIPSTHGSGTQVKTLDAIATGRAVVATPVAMRGITAPPPTVKVAHSPESFANELVRGAAMRPEVFDRAALTWVNARARNFDQAVANELSDIAQS